MIKGRVVPIKDQAGTVKYWRIRLDYGRDEKTGKRHEPRQPGRYATEKEGRRALGVLLHELNSRPVGDPSRRTVAGLVIEWLETEAAVALKPGNLPNYESCCRLHVLPYLGAAQASRLTTADLEQWRTKRLAAGLSRNMMGKASLHLGQAYDFGQRHGYVTHNPVRALKRLAREHREMQVWDAEQARKFLAVAQHHLYEPLWSLALATGCRVGELLALEWGDLDLAAGTLAVRRSLAKVHEHGTGSPKSGRARLIEIDPALAALLTRHQTAQKARALELGKAYGNRRLVVATQDGQYLSHSNVNRAMRGSKRGTQELRGGLCVAAGVPYIRVHGLRHTSATLLLARGVPVKVVSERLGHASIAITLDLYAHTLPGMQRKAADDLGSILFGTV